MKLQKEFATVHMRSVESSNLSVSKGCYKYYNVNLASIICSILSIDDFDCSGIAKYFGGGGHLQTSVVSL